jgi:hypothetical protein
VNKGDFHAEGDSKPLLILGVSANLRKKMIFRAKIVSMRIATLYLYCLG